MKKSLIALAVLGAFTGMAHAQSSVTLYGSVDAGLRDQTNTTKAGGNKIGMSSNGNFYSNRFGFKGKEDLGGGLSANFRLEAGFNSGTGALNNTNNLLFQRNATVGLASKNLHSSVNFGRQFNVEHDTVGQYDPERLKFLPITGVSPMVGGTSARDDNVIRYDGQFGGLHARAQLALGGQAGSFQDGSSEGVGFTYASGPASVGAAYTHRSHYAGNTIAPPFYNENHYTMGGAYSFGSLRASVGFVGDTQMTATPIHTTDRYLFGGLEYRITPFFMVTGAYYAHRNSTANVSGRQDIAILSAVYSLSKRTMLYFDVDNTHYTGVYLHNATLNPSGRSNSVGASAGINMLF